MITAFFVLPPGFPYGPIFVVVAVVVLFYLWSQHHQKMELIKRGESVVAADALEQMKYRHLSKGLITTSLALGFLAGSFLMRYSSVDPWVSYASMLLLFFGLGALVFYVLIKNK